MKKIFFVFLFWICCLNSFAQGIAPSIQWQNTIGGSNSDGSGSIQQTSDGGYIIGGTSSSNISGDKTENSIGSSDYWIVKIDSLGNIQWQNTIGGSGYDGLVSIQQTSDGGYILGGESNSDISGDKSENSLGPITTEDFWIVKVNMYGNIEWQNTIGGNLNDRVSQIQQTNDGGFILGGYSNSGISGDKTESALGTDYWVVKLNSLGNILWQNTIGGNGNDLLLTLDLTSDGGFILGGSSTSNISGDKTENVIGGSGTDAWIIKIDSVGNIQWQNTIGGNAGDDVKSIHQTNDGGYILGGNSNSNISGDKTENSFNNLNDYWVIKVDSIGNIQWQNTIGGNVWDILFSINQTSDGGYILGGYSTSNLSGDKNENSQGGYDYWVMKLNTVGTILWQNIIGGNNNDYLYSVSQTLDNGYILTGSSQSPLSGDKTEDTLGGAYGDIWIIKLAPDNGCNTCHKPTNLSSLSISNTKEKLMWTTEPCANGYRVYHRAIGTSNWIVNVVGSNNGFKTISNLTPNTTYEWKVKSICSNTPFIASFATTIHTFTTPLRLEDETKTQNNIILYPNPATNEIKISNLSPEENQITIYNLLGQQVKSLSVINEQNHIFNISDLPSGIYMLTVSNNKKISCKKFVKE